MSTDSYDHFYSIGAVHRFLRTIKHNREIDNFCDFRIIVDDGRIIKCHKFVLIFTSLFFKDLFTSNPELKEYKISGVKHDIVQEAISFMYNCQCILHQDTVLELLDLAVKWKLFLREECFRYICTKMDIDHARDFYQAAIRHKDQLSLDQISYFIRNNFEEMYKRDHFKDFTVEAMVQLTKSDMINVRNENVILLAITSMEMLEEKPWMNLLNTDNVRLEYLTNRLSQALGADCYISEKQKDFIRMALTYKEEFNCGEVKRPARYWHQLVCIDDNGVLCRYYKTHNHWKKTTTVPDCVNNEGSFLLAQDFLICIYPSKKGFQMLTISLSRPFTKVNCGSLPKDVLTKPTIFFADGCIFIAAFCCHLEGVKSSNKIYRYSAFTSEWDTVGHMLEHTLCPIMLRKENAIYILGGLTSSGYSGIVQECNIKTGKWRYLRVCPHPLNDFKYAGTVYRDVIAVAGERNLLIYNISNDFWTTIDRSYIGPVLSLFVVDDYILALVKKNKLKIKKYYPKKKCWLIDDRNLPKLERFPRIFKF